MKFIHYDDAEDFSKQVLSVVGEQEDKYSLFLGILASIRKGDYENPFLATIEEDGKVLALFQMTPPHPMNMIYIEESRMDMCMELFIQKSLEEDVDIPSVISLKEWATQFAGKWIAKTGLKEEILMDQGLYRLDSVNKQLEKTPGNWRLASSKDHALIQNWYHLFEQDTGLPITPQDIVKQRVQKFVEAQEVFLWEDEGRIVSMMKKSRPTARGITVSLVYTPTEERRKGYARTLVAACSKELLKDYEFCMLYTDMLNPTSNKIYQEIGYQKIADSMHIGFV